LDDALPHFSAQNDGLSYLLHRPLLLLALALQGQEGFVLAKAEFSLQNALAALNEFSRFQLSEFQLSKREIPISAPSRDPTTES
jgi:hypothetical protein